MKRILINATHNEEVRVALCKGNHLYDFDLENRTREQKKSNIYKGHVTRVEPSLEAVFVEYGSKRQGFLPIREIASNYLAGNPRDENIRKLIKEGDELIVQVEKEERGNKGAALSTYVSLAGRYLVLMPNNPKGGGISRQISGKLREDMKRMLGNLDLPKGMSVIVRTAGIGKTQEDLQHDLNHLLNIWNAIQDQNEKYPSPRLVHQESGVVTRAVRDYLRDDISEIWIDNEEAFIEAETFVKAVMPKQLEKLRKYTDYEPMFSSFGVERQIETAYQREVRLPSGGSIVIDQTEALVSIDINSAKSTKGADVSETAYHTNLEAADEIARQLRLRDMGGLVVIDFIDMNDSKHQKEVEKRLVDATKYDRARVQFGDISRFGLMEMSRQRLRPSLEESTGYICPRCHGNGMIRDLRSLSLSIMRQIEQTALKERHGEVQAEVPTDIAAFLLNEKRESLVYLEQDSGTRITILPHAHLESPNFNLHFNHQGFAPSSYERVTDTQQQESSERGYDVDWQTSDAERPEQQPTRQPRPDANKNKAVEAKSGNSSTASNNTVSHPTSSAENTSSKPVGAQPSTHSAQPQQPANAQVSETKPAAVAWLSNLFAPTPQAQKSASVSSAEAAQAIEAIVNTGAQSRGVFGDVSAPIVAPESVDTSRSVQEKQPSTTNRNGNDHNSDSDNGDKDRRKSRNNRNRNKYDKRNNRNKSDNGQSENRSDSTKSDDHNNRRRNKEDNNAQKSIDSNKQGQHNNKSSQDLPRRESNSRRESRGAIERNEAKTPHQKTANKSQERAQSDSTSHKSHDKSTSQTDKDNRRDRKVDPNEVNLRVTEAELTQKENEVVHISLDDNQAIIKTASTVTTDKSNEMADGKKEVDAVMPEPKLLDSVPVSERHEQTTAVEPKDLSEPDVVIKNVSLSSKSPSLKSPLPKKASDTSTSEVAEPATVKDVKQDASLDKDEKELLDKTLSFNTDALFSERYVAAQKFGQAANDPRVVKASLQKDAKKKRDAQEIVPPAPVSKINGSVGEFIHNHLAQAGMRLAKDGVITCFLSALNAHGQTSGGNSKRQQPTQVAVEPVQAFSFINYGYQSLSSSYLEQFAKMTSAAAAYHTDQGKTDVAPKPIAQRASNDPRGQNPQFVGKNTQIEEDGHDTDGHDTTVDDNTESRKNESSGIDADAVTVDNHTNTATNDVINDSNVEQSPAEAMRELLKLNAGSFIQRVLGEEGLEIINSGQTEVAFLKALNQPLDVLLSVAESVNNVAKNIVGESVDTNQSANISTSLAETSDGDSLEMAQSSDSNIDTENDSSTSSSQTSNKTSIESYKSMIETISEQLLPQTGILNLSSTKVPKTRSRKAKEETKAPAQVDTTTGNDEDDS